MQERELFLSSRHCRMNASTLFVVLIHSVGLCMIVNACHDSQAMNELSEVAFGCGLVL